MRANELVVVSSLLLSAAVLAGACGSAGTTGGNGEGADGGGQPGTGATGVDSGGTIGSPTPSKGADAGTLPGTGDDAGSSDDGAASGEDATTDDSSTSGDGGFVPAAHPSLPLLATSGGAVLANPVVQPIFFSKYDLTAQMTEMVAGLPTAKLANGDTYWTAAVSEYGVGALTVLPAINLTIEAPTTDTDPVAFLQSQLTTAPFAHVTSSTILALFYPLTTPLAGSCAAVTPGYGGYHDNFSNGTGQQPFAVMVECAKFGPIKDAEDMVSVAASHEIIEAATDPFPSSTPAYTGLESSPSGFSMAVFLQGNAENGDMCAINAGFGRGPAAYPFLLSRGWSNKAVRAGNLDPCSPDIRPDQPFVGAYPVMPDTVTVAGGGSGPGVVIPVGQSKTVEVDLFSFEPTAAFNVLARQGSDVQPPTLTFTWDKTSGKNGDKLHLTITSVTADPSGYESFVLQTSLPGTTDTQEPAWAGVVTH